MLDLGCHAGHGPHINESDATRWLLRFHHPGSIVVGVDAVEDYALDIHHRMNNIEPFRSMTGVRKLGLPLAISNEENQAWDARGAVSTAVNCCFGFFCGTKWDALEAKGVIDHLCRIPRQRVGAGGAAAVATRAAMALPKSSQSRAAWRHAQRSGRFDGPFPIRLGPKVE